VWSDEFDGNAIDSTKWSHEVNCDGGGNNELQCYTADAANSYVEDGKLHIAALHHGGDDYTSARLRTLNKGDWKYGRIEVKAKMPQGQGLWPAIWMLPSDWIYGGWPLSGEIDIFEAVNPNGTGGNTMYGTLHYGRYWPNNNHSGAPYTPAANIWDEFHTYAIEWEEGEIRWYVNDTHYATQTQDGWFTYYYDGQEVGFQFGGDAAPFDQAFHLLLNVAVGGNWPGNPDVSTPFPQQMVVDYVRVYECSADTATGVGCASNVDPEIEPLAGHPAEQYVFSLYENGPSTLIMDAPGSEVENTLVPALWQETAGNIVSNPAVAQGEATVWDVQFNGPGNVFLLSGDMSGVEGVNEGFKLTNMATYGELRLDLRVLAIDPATELLVKLDSVWPDVSYHSIDIPPTGEWTTVTVRFSEMVGTSVNPDWGTGEANLNKLVSPFVLEAIGGTAHVQINNVRITCLSECDVDPILEGVSDVLDSDFDVLVDAAPGANWDYGIDKWDGDSGHVTITTETDVDRGDVTQVTFSESANNGLMFVQSTSAKDLSAFATNDGYLTFDIKVLSYGSNTSGLVVKMESGPATGTGDYVIESPALNTWTTVQIPIADMLNHPGTSGAFDISAMNTPFVFLPVWGDQSGVQVQLDEVRWVAGDGTATPNQAIEESFDIFVDGMLGTHWENIYTWADSEGHVQLATPEDVDRGTVLEANFVANGFGLVFFQSANSKDLTAFADTGYLTFDIKVTQIGDNSGEFVVKADCEYPCSSGDISIGVLPTGSWETITIPVSDLVAGGLDSSKVDTPLVVFPAFGQQFDVTILIDNARWILPVN
jgi:beta-glucanase (GH16 family)